MDRQTEVKTALFRVGGMFCENCRTRIEKTLKNTPGIEDVTVDFSHGTATVRYRNEVIDFGGIRSIVEGLGYTVSGEEGAVKAGPATGEIVGTLVIILALYMLLRQFGVAGLTPAFPLAGGDPGIAPGLLLITGLVTSLHCVAMCGGINLSQTLGRGLGAEDLPRSGKSFRSFAKQNSTAFLGGLPPLRVLLPSVLYNVGRVISYTAVGVVVGALGSALSLPGRLQGLVQLVAGVFMVIMGINMLGIFPGLRRFSPRLPAFLAEKLDARKRGRGPLVIGLLNGFMPCGPLQAMQLYALSTGSPLRGGLAMFLFSLGTFPLMFGLGALGSVLSGSRGRIFSRRVMKAGAVLVTVMGMGMFSYGVNLSGFDFAFADRLAVSLNPVAAGVGGSAAFTPLIENGVQVVNSVLSGGHYPAITVRQGLPVRWTISAPAGSINGCNNRMIIREYGIEHRFKPGDNVIEFTPGRAGKFTYSCWMGMIRSSITVLAEGELAAAESSSNPVPAGVAIPVDRITVAELAGAYQIARVDLRDEGMEPAVIVLQRGLPAVWIINNDSADPGNGRLVIPSYYTQLDIEPGQNVIRLLPAADFDYSTADNVFYGYVKVVDDLLKVDVEAVKAEVSDFETLIYPDAYFEEASQGGMNCCRGMQG